MNTSFQEKPVQDAGCGSASCQCGGQPPRPDPAAKEAFTALQRPRAGSPAGPGSLPRMEPELLVASDRSTVVSIARINGIALHSEDELPDPDQLRERAYAELLRQECVGRGLLPAVDGEAAPQLSEEEHEVIEVLLDHVVSSPQPTAEECRRYFDAQSSRFVQGQALRARHILFAVTPGVDVQALSKRAEMALATLKQAQAGADPFGSMARDWSNCPSSVQGGDLGWIEPQSCAPELARVFFHQDSGMMTIGLHPRLVHSRFGLHIVEVLEQRKGSVPDFSLVQDRIAAQLQLQSRARALHQYILLLAGRAKIEGLALEAADSPLVQ